MGIDFQKDDWYWFHCASLGEFDQAIPLIEEVKRQKKGCKILVTFFSPSGMKHYHKRNVAIDFACFLPIDTKRKAEEFIKHINPQKAFFIKYEFWHYHLVVCRSLSIELFSVCSIFRENQSFFKPYGILSQFTSDVPSETLGNFNLPKDVYPTGRLDKDSEGLLILSNDGSFIDQLLNPKFDKEKIYWVQVENIPSEESLDKLRRGGISIQDYKTRPAKVKILDPQPEFPERNPPVRFRQSIPTCWLEIIISEGKNRQVRRMTASINHPTLRLVRMQVGKYKLGTMTPGEWREIKKSDIL